MSHKTYIKLKGMTCRACEEVIKMQFEELVGVKTVSVSLVNQTAEIHADRKIVLEEVHHALAGTHYSIINLE